MVDDLRAEVAPELRWDAMEKALFARIDASPVRAPRPAPVPSPFGRLAAFAACAAIVAFGVGSADGGRSSSRSAEHATVSARHVVDVAAVGHAPGSGSSLDLDALNPGDVVEASRTAVSFAKAGLVAWSLQPGSSLRVLSVGVGHTVALERGSLRAEVTPRDPSEGMIEAFAVEVGGTRIAVHGTAFSVHLDGGQLVVDVEHGAVAVGPTGHVGTTTGRLLVGPSRATFSLDGGRVARFLDRPAVVTPTVRADADDHAPAGNAVVEPPSTVLEIGNPAPALNAAGGPQVAPMVLNPAGSASHGPHVDVAKTAEPAAEAPPRLTVDMVRARLDRCFRRTFEAAPSALESVSSTLTIEVNPDGAVRAARFNPPQNAAITACAGSAIAGRFADDAGRLEIPIAFRP